MLLKKLTSRLRCYVSVTQVEDLLSSIATSSSKTKSDWIRPSSNEITACRDLVGKRFQDRKQMYWEGEWSLASEIVGIPGALWTDTVLTMTSKKRTTTWTIAAKASGARFLNTFPVSNSSECMPKPSIEEALNKGFDYSRTDLLLCVRVLKFMEQLVLSRTNGVSGPLTVTASVAGICEVSPSFVSVLNSMGVFMSYNVRERHRQRLIAARERSGPWILSCTDSSSIPLLQFDNWDIKPLHAVKVDNKAMPKVNGSFMQGVSKKRKQSGTEPDCRKAKRPRTEGVGSWRCPSVLGNRGKFAGSFNSKERRAVLNQFNDIVFGVTSLFRTELLGGKERNDVEYNTGIRKEYEQMASNPPVIFRTLLLSSFKPHGFATVPDEILSNQHVVYVEIIRDNAADILTVRRFLRLVEEQLKPRRPNCPRYVLLAGDQPSYKMFCELWLESWRIYRKNVGGVVSDRQNIGLHEWMVPLPSFFHTGKHAVYSLCKEMLDGLGLEEHASCAGLSKSQVANIMSHSHARNNRAVLFNLACSMVIHITDMLAFEDEDVSRQVEKMHTNASGKKRDCRRRHGLS